MERRFPLGAGLSAEMLTADPHPHLALLRRREPVSWVPALDGWLVTSRDLAVSAMRDPTTFTVDHPGFSTAQVIGPSMLSLDGAEHQLHRSPFAGPFQGENLRAAMHEWAYARATELVASLAPAGEGDLRAGLAAPLAIEGMNRVLGLSGVHPQEVLDWYKAIVDAVHEVTQGREVPDSGRQAFSSLHKAVTASLDTSPFLSSALDAGGLDLDEVVSNVAVLLFGGIVTADSSTAIALRHLLDRPLLLAEIASDHGLIGAAVEESFRYEPSASMIDRYATRPLILAGAEIAAGDLVRLSLAAANRDESVFENPDVFDPRRDNVTQHVTFARGPHACLGIHLARLETRAAITAALSGLPGLRDHPERSAPIEGLVFRAPPAVWAKWDVGRADGPV